MPVFLLSRGGKTKRELDMHGLVAILRNWVISHAFVEQVASMPGQGVSSVFAFGQAYGAMLGVLAATGIPFTKVPPARWKRTLGVPAAKDGARARASELLPESAPLWRLVKHDGRAEAALIGLYGYRVFQPLPYVQPAGHNKFGLTHCPFCRAAPAQFVFRDAGSAREYEISGLCQDCQDHVFEDKSK